MPSPAVSQTETQVARFFELSLLGLLASGFLAVAGSGYLDLPTIVLTSAALVIRALLVTGLIHFELPVILSPLHGIAQHLIGVGEHSEPFRVAGLLIIRMVASRHNAVHAFDSFDLRPGIDLQQIVVVNR